MSRRVFRVACAGGLCWLAFACVPQVTGAPCESDENCPAGQRCGADARCALGTGPETDAGAGDAGQPDGGGSCLDGSGNPVDLQSDPNNCGRCGEICPAPVNAAAACDQGSCGRGPCGAGYFDIDGEASFGCESTCSGKVCTYPDGGVLTLSNQPIHETGLVAQDIASGTAAGARVQTSATYSNFGTVGSVTPAVDGGLEVGSSRFRHRGGFGAKLR